MPEETHATSGVLAGLREGIEFVSVAIEMLAIVIIVVGIVIGTVDYFRRSTARPPDPNAYGQYKARMARSLLLGLEILVAADIVRTVALDPTLNAIAALGLLVAGPDVSELGAGGRDGGALALAAARRP